MIDDYTLCTTKDPFIGVDNPSGGECTRRNNIVLMHFQIPTNFQGFTFSDLQLRLEVSKVLSGGAGASLHGLGVRSWSIRQAIAMQSVTDFNVGVADSNPGAELLIAEAVSIGAPATTYSLRSAHLMAYVQAQLDEYGAGSVFTLRLSGISAYGCNSTGCFPGCEKRRVKLVHDSVSLNAWGTFVDT